VGFPHCVISTLWDFHIKKCLNSRFEVRPQLFLDLVFLFSLFAPNVNVLSECTQAFHLPLSMECLVCRRASYGWTPFCELRATGSTSLHR
jgi:hypothetical protein